MTTQEQVQTRAAWDNILQYTFSGHRATSLWSGLRGAPTPPGSLLYVLHLLYLVCILFVN